MTGSTHAPSPRTDASAWAGRRVLVTGATGFIGSAVARRLSAYGATVVGAARRLSAGESPVRVEACDLSDLDQCRALITETKPEVVIHTAGHPFAARDLSRVMPTFRDNLETTVNLLATTAEAKVSRIVLSGSLEEPESGDVSGAISSPYSLSKWAASGYARLFHSLYDHPVVIARLFMVYGPGQRDLTKLIPGSIVKLLRGDAPKITSGERPVDWVFVEDVVDGLLAAALAPGIDGRTIDLGTGIMTTVRTVVETLAGLIPGSPAPQFGSVPARSNEQVRAARVDQTRALLNWSPSVGLSDGLKRTIDWVRAEGPRAK
jgi:nucleoside-diphosphate-sugar epimerase